MRVQRNGPSGSLSLEGVRFPRRAQPDRRQKLKPEQYPSSAWLFVLCTACVTVTLTSFDDSDAAKVFGLPEFSDRGSGPSRGTLNNTQKTGTLIHVDAKLISILMGESSSTSHVCAACPHPSLSVLSLHLWVPPFRMINLISGATPHACT